MATFKFAMTSSSEDGLSLKKQAIIEKVNDMRERYISYFKKADNQHIEPIVPDFKPNSGTNNIYSLEVTITFSDDLPSNIKSDLMYNIKDLYNIVIKEESLT